MELNGRPNHKSTQLQIPDKEAKNAHWRKTPQFQQNSAHQPGWLTTEELKHSHIYHLAQNSALNGSKIST